MTMTTAAEVSGQKPTADLRPNKAAQTPAASQYDSRTSEKVAIGKRLRIARMHAGMKQADAAKRAGYTAAVHLSEMETGRRPVTLEKLIVFAGLYGSSVDYFLGLREDVGNDPAAALHATLSARITASVDRLTHALAGVSVEMARKLLPDVIMGQRLAMSVLEINSALQVVASDPAWQDIRGGSTLQRRITASADLAAMYLGQLERARRVRAYGGTDADITGKNLQLPIFAMLLDEPEEGGGAG